MITGKLRVNDGCETRIRPNSIDRLDDGRPPTGSFPTIWPHIRPS